MKQLTKKDIINLMVDAAYYQTEVYQLYDIDIIEVTKYKNCLKFAVHYNPSEVAYDQLYSLFRQYFNDYKKFICKDDCYSNPLLNNVCVAHFELKFYA